MSDLASVRRRILLLRQSLGLGVSAFAREIGIPLSTISEVESGKANVTLNTFWAICSRFNIDPAWLGFGIGEMHLSKERLRQYSAAQRALLDKVDEINRDISDYPLSQFLAKTLDPDNFIRRRPKAAAPGLIRLLGDKELLAALRPNADELAMIADMIVSQPRIYQFAEVPLFLELIRSHRQARLQDVIELLARLHLSEGKP